MSGSGTSPPRWRTAGTRSRCALEDGGRLTGRAAIVALPLNVWHDVVFDPPLTGGKAGAASRGHVGRSSKVLAIARNIPDHLAGIGWDVPLQAVFSMGAVGRRRTAPDRVRGRAPHRPERPRGRHRCDPPLRPGGRDRGQRRARLECRPVLAGHMVRTAGGLAPHHDGRGPGGAGRARRVRGRRSTGCRRGLDRRRDRERRASRGAGRRDARVGGRGAWDGDA